MHNPIDFALKNPMNWLEDLLAHVSLSKANKQFVLNSYTQGNRGYHGLFHISFLWYCHKTLWPIFFVIPVDPLIQVEVDILMADSIFCHDMIYDASSLTNEIDSAMWWKKKAYKSANVTWVQKAIEATSDHFADRPMDIYDNLLAHSQSRGLLHWLLGLDLISLAAPYEIFNTNQLMIRAEYSHLSNAKWNTGRVGFLTKASNSLIYRHPFFHKLCEADAKANLLRSLSEF
jgi:predicted metal-dependent HD superfamily phosphohydrolase